MIKTAKTIITNDGVQMWGIGKGLNLEYIVETTKKDEEIKNDYSNLHYYNLGSIEKAFKAINQMQKAGWYNINIVTNVKYKDNIIIQDCLNDIDLLVNTQEMELTFKNERRNKEIMLEMQKELEAYKEFIKKYNAEKTFQEFKDGETA